MTWHEEARRLAAQGFSDRVIATQLGVTPSAVWKVRNPARMGELRRADNKRRRAAKRAWDRTEAAQAASRHRAAERYRAVCMDCGQPAGSGTLYSDVRRCGACEARRRRDAHERLLDAIEHMWNVDGLTGPQIAASLGRHGRNAADPDLQELRRRGRLQARRPRSVAA